MDPLTAFSLAGTILQFVDSGARFIMLAQKMYQHGTDDIDAHVCLLRITEDLNAIIPDLKPIQNGDNKGKGLNQLAVNCSQTAERLLAILQKTKTTKGSRKRDAIKAAFILIFRKDDILSLEGQLSSFQRQLSLHLLLSIR